MSHISTKKKLLISVFSGVLFAVLSLPLMYHITNVIFNHNTIENGCPTITGIFIHSIIFIVIVFVSMLFRQ